MFHAIIHKTLNPNLHRSSPMLLLVKNCAFPPFGDTTSALEIWQTKWQITQCIV